jgi:hypothetical protein
MYTVKDEIPYFIKVRGCINCSASKELKKSFGTDYGFDHELMSSCFVMGCLNYNYNLVNPYLDIEEAVRVVKLVIKECPESESTVKENLKSYLLYVKGRFGRFYERLGISLDDFVTDFL